MKKSILFIVALSSLLASCAGTSTNKEEAIATSSDTTEVRTVECVASGDVVFVDLDYIMASSKLFASEGSALETKVKEFQYQLAVYIYVKGLGNGKFSMATAVGLFQSLIGVALVLLSDKIAKKLGEDGLL